jgi:hypothetical protein
MYAHIGRLAILQSLHVRLLVHFKEKENVAISGIRTPKELSGNGFTKNRDPGIRVYDPGIRV